MNSFASRIMRFLVSAPGIYECSEITTSSFWESSNAFWTNGSVSRLMFSRSAWMCLRIDLSSGERRRPSVVRPFGVSFSQIIVLIRAVVSG